MIPNSPARVPLWLANRKWRLDGRRRIDIARGFVLGLRLGPRLYRERWQIWAGPYATLDGRRRQPAFYGIERQMSVSPNSESSC